MLDASGLPKPVSPKQLGENGKKDDPGRALEYHVSAKNPHVVSKRGLADDN